MPDVVALVHAIRARDGPRDARIAGLASRQHGVVARRQLLDLGLDRGAIARGLAAGRLHRVHVSVYAVGHPGVTRAGRWMAAVLAGGPGAVLSHRTAAAVWGLVPSGRGRIHVTVPGRRGGPRGITVHRARRLHGDDRSVQDGFPVTSVARTLLDLAEVFDADRLGRAVEEAERLRIVDMADVDRLLRRSRGRHGMPALRAALADAKAPAHTRSELERAFLRFCRDTGVPPPRVNALVAGLEVDAVWPEQRLVVELDGYAFHRTRAAFERDRARDARLQLAGCRVVRVTARRLAEEPDALARTLRGLLSPPAPP